MPTKLGRYASGVLEACWLAAIILVPSFFNIYSSRIFEPDKLTLLRTIALLILAMWLVKAVEAGGLRWERQPENQPAWKSFLQVPLVAPILALTVVYVIATVFSITPRVSLWGSYQRLQGTYTTFSYLIVFAAISVNLRSRAQVERLITTAIVTSLPISLYGILQRYKIDPVPWGGDVTRRIASNMGNSIFLAAYLIMVNPLTLVRIFESSRAILRESRGLAVNMARATAYIFIAALQLIALFFSGSRGPWLGWMAGSFFLFVLLSMVWRKRWMTVTVVGAAGLIAIFLVILNIPRSPLQNLLAYPGIGRLGELLSAESRTGRVRTLIWQGASELVQPHQPLEFPDGRKDPFNGLRPLIGYGPESMYVAYSPFYPPELTQVEKRNASPDRSHNETWDALVITGVFGLMTYLALFASVIYYALKWLGLVTSPSQRNLFLGLFLGGGVAGAVGFVLWRGPAYFGVALPFGTIIGILIYLTLAALFGHYQTPQTEGERLRALTLIGLLSVIVAHFVEINFGIAIAATRTYFFAFSGLLLVVGHVLPRYGEYVSPMTGEADLESLAQREGGRLEKNQRSEPSRKKKRQTRAKSRTGFGGWPEWLSLALMGCIPLALLLVTLGYNFITPLAGSKSALGTVWSSLIHLRSTESPVSYGMLAMVMTSWLVGSVLFPSEENRLREISGWLRMFGVTLGASLLPGLVFWTWHASALVQMLNVTARSMTDLTAQLDRFGWLLTRYYIYIFALFFVAGFIFSVHALVKTQKTARLGVVVAPIALIVAFSIASYTNLRVIQADIAFKQADPYVKQSQWPIAIEIYKRTNRLAPTEDYYYLFLGRAYLEHGRSLDDPQERENLITQAREDLEKAQTINPLNIDHTANLARLHNLWAGYSSDTEQRAERAQTSSDYFSRAVVISPNNARLWDEWALLHLNTLKQPEGALERLNHSLEIDPYYDWTYALLGDYHSRAAQTKESPEEKKAEQQTAVEYYQEAITYTRPSDVDSKYNYLISLANLQIQMEDLRPSAQSYEDALALKPKSADAWKIEETLTRLYFQLGEIENALRHATNALASAPEAEKERLQSMISQLRGQPAQQP